MPNWSGVRFSEAFRVWIESRVSISLATRHGYHKDYKRLAPFFADLRLGDIGIEEINAYRKLRLQKCGANSINKELNVVQQIMSRAGLWEDIAPWYERLAQAEYEGGIALTAGEEAHLFSVAATNGRWSAAYLSSLLMRNTGMSFGELRMLTLANFDTHEFQWIRIKKGWKNKFRIRTIPCNKDAAWALSALYRKARRAGCYLPGHFVLPGRGPTPEIPLRRFPYSAWYTLRKAAGAKPGMERLQKVKPYDMRRTVITNLLENPSVNYNVIEAFAGHQVDSTTKRIYDYIRSDNLKRAADMVCSDLSLRKHPEAQLLSIPPIRARSSNG